MNLKQKYLSIIPALILFLAFIYSSCSEDNPVVPPPPPDKEQFVKLSTLTVTCTEAFINVSVNDTLLPLNITLNRDDSPVFNFNLTKNDTTVIDTNLSPGSSYNYTAAAVINGEEWKGDKLQIQTLATTSHNFTWQTFTFGEPTAGSSVLNDVAIIDENNIWAVGEIYMNDSTGQPDPLPYNAAHWDGSNWELKRISVNFRGNLITPPLNGVFTFSPSQIWLAGGLAIYGDGNSWIPYDVRQITGYDSLSFTKCWGSSSTDMYFIGRSGSIAHYQNSSWSKIESGTDLPINDIWGINYLSETKVLAVASNIYQFQDKKILSVSSSGVTEISNDGLPWSLGSVWFSNIYKSYTGGDGLYVKYNEQNSWDRIPLPLYYIFSIRGNGLNDIIVCGGLGYVGHFNGSSWINYLGNGLEEISGNYYSSAIKENKVCAVGATADGKAVAVIGTR